jgi:hypothetical protein
MLMQRLALGVGQPIRQYLQNSHVRLADTYVHPGLPILREL